jgi:hypothetical protein
MGRALVRWAATALALTILTLHAVPAAANGAAARPLIPLNTNFWSYWTHYWATWLPDHPVYEMIELTAYEDPEDPREIFVRVFLTEREGRKTQYFYLNDATEVERSRANAFHRDIVYRRSGRAGGPQNLHVAFVDKDGVPIEWTIEFDESAELREHGAGATDSIHSVGSVLLFALRTRTVDTHRDRVLFAGTDYAHGGPPDDGAAGTRSWYNPDYYSAVVVFGRVPFSYEGDAVVNNWGRRFTPLREDPSVYRSGALGPENFIQLELDEAGAMRSYAHFSRGHALRFAFDPPLPPLARLEPGARIGFTASFDEDRPLMAGDIEVRRTAPDTLLLEWRPTTPEWARERAFGSLVRHTETGYELTSGELRAAPGAEGSR